MLDKALIQMKRFIDKDRNHWLGSSSLHDSLGVEVFVNELFQWWKLLSNLLFDFFVFSRNDFLKWFLEMMRTLKSFWMILKCLEFGFRKSHFKGERMDGKILDVYKNNSRVWSWPRMNASNRLNTCKLNASLDSIRIFMMSSERVSNT